MLYIQSTVGGVRKTKNFSKYKGSLEKKILLKIHFKIKLSFLLGGMVVGSTSGILVEDGRPGIKEVCHVSEFRSFQCNHLGTNIWRFLERLDPEGRGATKGQPRHGLVCKRN